MTDQPAPAEYTAAKITISRVIGEDGRVAILQHITPRDFSATELLGMLAMAQEQIFTEMRRRRGHRDEY
jgi:hypothetical protein